MFVVVGVITFSVYVVCLFFFLRFCCGTIGLVRVFRRGMYMFDEDLFGISKGFISII